MRIIDALILLFSPIISVITQLLCLFSLIIILLGYNSPLFQVMFQILAISLIISIFITAVILLVLTPWKRKSILLGLLIQFYWWLIGLIILKWIGEVLLRSKRGWVTIDKRGIS
ncbi:MAG: hypothetical protein QXW86_12070 [Saccharolobus sp.]|uniref:hypothetical protein n=1 Tax=Saccharolobus sp. TaxID=2100761 RepID=UPI00317E29DE